MLHCKVRRIEASDMEAVVNFAKTFTESINKDFNVSVFTDYVLEMDEKGLVLIAEVDGEFAGVTSAMESKNHFTGAKVLYRMDIGVEPKYRGKGIAKALMAKLKEIGEVLGFQEYSWSNDLHLKHKR